MKILITGANGFIGKSIIELLDKNKYEIIPITKPSPTRNPTIYEYDLQDESEVDRMFDFFQNIDFVIHCATVGGRRNKPETPYVFAINVSMFNNLIKHRDKFKWMITFGSGAEKDPLSYYGISKKFITEKIVRECLPAISLKLWGCFGKYETNDRFIKSNIIRYINKEDLIIHQNKRMDYFYINDIIPVINSIFEKGIRFSISTDLVYKDVYSLYDIARVINELDDYKVNIIIENKKDLGEDYLNSNFNTRQRLFNYYEFIGLEQGIREVYNHLKNDRNR